MESSPAPTPHEDMGDHQELGWGGAWIGACAALVAAAFVGLGGAYVAQSRVDDPVPIEVAFGLASLTTTGGTLRVYEPGERDVDSYRGHGAWVDVFDYDPAYAGPTPSVGPADLAEMADVGVRTLYLQAARLDDRTPQGLVDPWRLADLLLGAHRENIDVVAWYLPRFGDDTADLDRLVAMHEFEVMGHRFDGLAVDIEWTGDGIDHDTRTTRLLSLTTDLRSRVGDDPVAAITPPPVLMEVINPDFWPGFPWAELAPHYDVWMPMSYWSFRSEASGYGDGYNYHEESVRRLRLNLGDENALVHGIGGIGGVDGIDDALDTSEPLATIGEVERFLDALTDSGSIGGSIYDWNTLEPAVRDLLAAHFAVEGGTGSD